MDCRIKKKPCLIFQVADLQSLPTTYPIPICHFSFILWIKLPSLIPANSLFLSSAPLWCMPFSPFGWSTLSFCFLQHSCFSGPSSNLFQEALCHHSICVILSHLSALCWAACTPVPQAIFTYPSHWTKRYEYLSVSYFSELTIIGMETMRYPGTRPLVLPTSSMWLQALYLTSGVYFLCV